jgi:hypothetical protein
MVSAKAKGFLLSAGLPFFLLFVVFSAGKERWPQVGKLVLCTVQRAAVAAVAAAACGSGSGNGSGLPAQ